MANEEQLAILKQGVEVWNEWRQKNGHVHVDLRGASLVDADLRGTYPRRAILKETTPRPAILVGANLTEADLRGAILVGADLRGANLTGADLRGAILRGANLSKVILNKANLKTAHLNNANLGGASLLGAHLNKADLYRANLSEAYLLEADFNRANLGHTDLRRSDLRRADLGGTDLNCADLRGAHLGGADIGDANLRDANLTGASLTRAHMVGTQLQGANLSNCRIFGIAAWNVNLEGAIQSNLIITEEDEPEITVDNLEVAQFVYLLIHNEKLRDIIDTIGKKAVLILGRFTEERLAVLQAIREELRSRDYIPILFDFEKPESRDVTETVSLLAHMARFVIADLTDAKSIPQELSHIVPDLPSVAVQPLILKDQRPYGMFEHFQRYPWVLPIHEYETQEQLIAELSSRVIEPAEAKVNELRPAK